MPRLKPQVRQPVGYVVSRLGSDRNPGSAAAPFAALARARDALRQIKRTLSRDAVVRRRGGTYTLDSTLAFGPEAPDFPRAVAEQAGPRPARQHPG